MNQSFDAVLVGAGQAAPPLAHRLAQSGMKIAFVERYRFGGTCVNTGCIPTKTWVASARAAHSARIAGALGIPIAGPIRGDMAAIKKRKDQIVRDSSSGVERGLRELEGCTVFQGTARFESPRTLRVGDVVLEAPKVFLDVGSRAIVPNIDGLRDTPFLTNSTLLNLDQLPAHLLVLGGSYVALEFAQMFRRFGSEVTVLQRAERLLTREDPDVADAIQQILEGEGLRIHCNVAAQQVRSNNGVITIAWPGGEARDPTCSSPPAARPTRTTLASIAPESSPTRKVTSR